MVRLSSELRNPDLKTTLKPPLQAASGIEKIFARETRRASSRVRENRPPCESSIATVACFSSRSNILLRKKVPVSSNHLENFVARLKETVTKIKPF